MISLVGRGRRFFGLLWLVKKRNLCYINKMDTENRFDKPQYNFEDLKGLISRLTAEDGCPWDKVQTHKSIRINLIEEAYEAVDAIDGGDKSCMIEELGDVLLQTVLHADIALRAGEFNIDDIITALCRKLIARHTHIFGSDNAKNSDAALTFWEKAKAKEKQYHSIKDQLEKYPQNFSAALKAEKIFNKLLKEMQKKPQPLNVPGNPDSAAASNTFTLCGGQDQNPFLKLFEEAADSLVLRKPSSNAAGEFLFLAVALTALCGFDAEAELNNYCRRVIDKSDKDDLLKIIMQLRQQLF